MHIQCITNSKGPLLPDDYYQAQNKRGRVKALLLDLGHNAPGNPSITTIYPQPDAINALEHIQVTGTLALSDEEKTAVRVRQEQSVGPAIKHIIGQGGAKRIPTIAVVASGGGVRAMLATLGVLKGLEETGLVNAVTYMCGLSGSTWALAQWISSKDPHSMDLIAPIQKSLVTAPEGFFKTFTSADLLQTVGLKGVFGRSEVIPQRYYFGQPYSLVDTWAKLIYHDILGYTSLNYYLTLSSQAQIHEGQLPIPIYTAVSHNCLRADQRKARFTNYFTI